MEKGQFVLYIVLTVVLLALVFVFVTQMLSLSERAEEELSPTLEEPEEVLESRYTSLVLSPEDLPEDIIYKLFRHFDPVFLNETSGPIVLYNVFILDLKGNEYDDTTGFLIENLTEGIEDFSAYDNLYQIGRDAQQPPNCGAVQRTNVINYNNDCWSGVLALVGPCSIYVNGDANDKFNDRIKIRVMWRFTGLTSPITDREIIRPIVTICDG